ncbi:MAG: DUF6602 domain-containing protein [Candidatus Pacearchaeota archaeon]|jgi:hypothetical protein
MVDQDFKKFYESLNQELIAVKDRVRNLIGKSHWGKDGEHKEAILKNVISKFLPKKYSMGTGFVINHNKEISTQIDIIIYDNSFPVLFSEGDFVVVLADSVKAIIEVKTSIKSTKKLIETIKKSEENAKKIEINFPLSQKIFNGIFSYECNLSLNTLEESLNGFFDFSECSIFTKVSNISLGNKTFLHVWWDHRPFELKGYELTDLSFAYFISNLLTSLDPYLLSENVSLFYPFKSKVDFERFSIVCPPGKWERYV